MSIQDTMNKLKAKGIPAAYIRFKEPQKPPFVIYRGNGQTVLPADNVYFYSVNDYQIALYFDRKNEKLEETIEQLLQKDGFLYEKSEDEFIEDEEIFVIYYQV